MEYALSENPLYLGLYYDEQRPTYDQALSDVRARVGKSEYSLKNVMDKYKR